MGIFDAYKSEVFATYHARLKFRNQLRAGIPGDPKIMQAWLRVKTGIDDETELQNLMRQTLADLGIEVEAGATYDDMAEAADKIADETKAQVFKRGENGLYLEARCVKAMLKEATAIVFDGIRWGGRPKVTKPDEMTGGKNARSVLAETVFINPEKIWLGKTEPDGIDTYPCHVKDWRGETQTSLARQEFVSGVTIEFDVLIARGKVPEDAWRALWILAQENGLGARRSQGAGTFDIEQWDKVG